MLKYSLFRAAFIADKSAVQSIDVCFNIDQRAYNITFTLKAELNLTIPPGATRPLDYYYALHLQCITISSTTSNMSSPGLDILFDHVAFWTRVENAILQLPAFERVVVAFALDTEGTFLLETFKDHDQRSTNRVLLDPELGKLLVAQSDKNPPRPGCKWVQLDPATFDATGKQSDSDNP